MPKFDFFVYMESRQELVHKHPQEFISRLGIIQNALYDNLLVTIKGMDVKKGAALEASKMNIAMAHKLRTDMARWLRENGYYDNIERFGKGYPALIRESKKYYKAMGLDPAFTDRDLNTLATIRKDDLNFLIKRDVDIINATYNEVMNAVYTNSDWRKLAARLKTMHTDTVFENGKTLRGLLKKYSATYANTAFAGFDRRIQNIKAQQYGLEYFYYSGSLISSSRSFCAARVGKVFTKKQIDAWQSMDWNGKARGRDVWVYLGGFNCSHILNPISESYAKEIMAENN